MNRTILGQAISSPSQRASGRRAPRPGLRWTGLLLAPLLAIPTSRAGPLEDAVDRIESKVNTIQSRTNTINTRTGDIQTKMNAVRSQTDEILGNTDGLQDLVGNVRDITSAFQPELFEDIREALQEAQVLLDFAKEQTAEALARRADHPDLVAFVRSMEDLLKALLRDEADVANLQVLSTLAGLLPEQVLAVAGEGLLRAGIDRAFVTRLQQSALDVALLQQTAESETRSVANSSQSLPAFLPAGSGCGFDRQRLNAASNDVLGLGINVKLAGKIIAAKGKTTASGNFTKNIRAGVHGYASLNIENDFAAILGKLMDGVADAMIAVAGAGSTALRHCEVLVYQRTLLEEMCMLSRFRSQACQHWNQSAEAAALRGSVP